VTAQESGMWKVSGIRRITSCPFLDQHPLASPLDKLVKHQTQIGHDETAHVEAEELSGVSCA
jgi:hypothetical protein